jgi:hypothetical protein
MAYTREIEKLELRWKENPKGTVFAPLAEVYRKDGQLQRAREVLREGLENNPDHIPGNIVLGRCCLDLKEDSAAEAAFVHVLQLDAENVIALKALADITERHGRLAEAEQWLRQLMAVDPSNDEAKDQMSRVEHSRNQAATLLYPAPVLGESPAPSEVELEVEPSAPVEPAPSPAPFRLGAEDETYLVPAFRPDLDRRATPLEYPSSAPPAPLEDLPLEAAMDSPPMPAGRVLPLDEAETVEVFPPRMAPPLHEADVPSFGSLSPAGIDALPEDADAPVVSGSVMGDNTTSLAPSLPDFDEDAPAPFGSGSREFDIGVEQAEDIVLRPSSSTEFQQPGDADELLQPSGASSEFQTPNDSEILLAGTHDSHEYQTPNDSEALLAAASEAHDLETVRPADSAWSTPANRQEESPEDLLEDIHEDIHEERPAAVHEEPLGEPLEAPLTVAWQEPDTEVPEEIAAIARGAEPLESPDSMEYDDRSPAATGIIADDEPAHEPAHELSHGSSHEPAEEADESTRATEPERWSHADATVPLESVPEPAATNEAETVKVSHEAAPAEYMDEEESDAPLVPASGLPLIFPEDADASIEATSAGHAISGSAAIEPDLIVTETMAELYQRQGHLVEALHVYRVLAGRAPGDPHLKAKVAELETALRAPSGEAITRRWPAYAASVTGGESVEAFFTSVLSARLSAPGHSQSSAMKSGEQGVAPSENGEPVDRHGSPTRPAQDRLSLSAIFGEDASPVPPVMPASEPAPGAAAPPASSGFSFDRFFAGASDAGASGPAGGERPSKPGGIEEDLDQFQNWLKGLKR